MRLRHTLAWRVLGGRFKKWLGIETRRLGEVKLWSWGMLLHVRFWGGEVLRMTWNCDKKSWRGEAVKLRHTVACRVLGGRFGKRLGIVTRTNSWRGEPVKLRHTLACMVFGGRFKKWIGLVTRRLGEVKLWTWGILLHVGFFWGGGLENAWESNKTSWRGEAVKLRNTLACKVWGWRFRKWLGF